MLSAPNALQWDGGPGHYEVYYLTLTDPVTGVGLWIRYTMVAPVADGAGEPTAALWFLAMDPRAEHSPTFGRKLTLPIDQLRAERDPFRLSVGEATLTDSGMRGSFEDVSWDLQWTPSARGYEHVHSSLRRAGIAKTVLVLPHADLSIDGTVSFGGEQLEISEARGGQAHLWGSKHASSWAWVHCNDFTDLDGEPVRDAFIDAVSVFVPRLGREVGPNTPVVGRIDGEDFISTSPLRVVRNVSTFTLDRLAVRGGRGEAQADRRGRRRP